KVSNWQHLVNASLSKHQVVFNITSMSFLLEFLSKYDFANQEIGNFVDKMDSYTSMVKYL
ncbi:unnamed protein product, partial [Trichogramma brassicae]